MTYVIYNKIQPDQHYDYDYDVSNLNITPPSIDAAFHTFIASNHKEQDVCIV